MILTLPPPITNLYRVDRRKNSPHAEIDKNEIKSLRGLCVAMESALDSILTSSSKYTDMRNKLKEIYPEKITPDDSVIVTREEVEKVYPSSIADSFTKAIINYVDVGEALRFQSYKSVHFAKLNAAELTGLYFKLLEVLAQTLWTNDQWSIEQERLAQELKDHNTPIQKIKKRVQATAPTFFTKLRKQWQNEQGAKDWSFNYPVKPAVITEQVENPIEEQSQDEDHSESDEINLEQEVEPLGVETITYVEPESIDQELANEYISGARETMVNSLFQQVPKTEQTFIKKIISYILSCLVENKMRPENLYAHLAFVLRYNKVPELGHKYAQISETMKFNQKVYQNAIKINLSNGNRLLVYTEDGKTRIEFMTNYHDKRK